ncbi:Asp23/Gls24 family envelope stress response protein [Streptosporangium sp. NPDC087985]|uniref:Asp23/Gls24 family envelope stress response protein n=1 Tax=Streptosporangium sp. NPDC087985 TaxID=3366196 RepID=UPI0038251BFD
MTEANTVNTPPRSDETSVPRARTSTPGGPGSLVTSKGTTSIDGGVVAKIAGIAAREVSGVYDMGVGTARALGAVRGMVGGEKSATQGVSVEVGERQTAADIDLVVEYGVAIPDVAAAVRRNVITAVERMTGLEVTEVNIRVDDVHMPDQERTGDGGRTEGPEEGSRVQ